MKITKRWSRFLFVVGALITALLTAGLVYEQTARTKLNSKPIASRTLVDVGGHKLHAVSTGSGAPTVVFESGLDPGGALVWFKVQGPVSRFTSTVSYDRAGIMFSERGNNPKTGEAIADELYTLLKKTQHKGPYILVGHSLAGLTLRSFVAKYPTEVAGIVLIDPFHPDMLNRFSERAKAALALPPAPLVDFAASTGLMRLMIKNTYPGTFPQDSINIRNNEYRPLSAPAVMEEYNNFDALAKEAAKVSSFGSIPLIIITPIGRKTITMFPDEETGMRAYNMWMQMQTELLDLSADSEHIYVDNVGHYVQLEQPAVVIDAIRKMIEKTRNKK
jgi:pimeloyl-ACP methyl ester carboxylesterase